MCWWKIESGSFFCNLNLGVFFFFFFFFLVLDLDLDQHSLSRLLFHLRIMGMSLTDQDFQFLIVNNEETQTFAVALSLCIQKQISIYH